MKEFYIALAKIVVGDYGLHDVWGGLIVATISALIVLRAYYGWVFLKVVKIQDSFLWLLGVYVTMRVVNPLINTFDFDFLKSIEGIDHVLIGAFSGTLNSWLFIKNYQPIKFVLDNKLFSKYQNKNLEILKKVTTVKSRISEIIEEVSKSFSIAPKTVLIELSNGGGTPKADTPLYYTILNSNSKDIIDLWGHSKNLCLDKTYKYILETAANGQSKFDTKDVVSGDYKTWVETKNLDTVYSHLVGTIDSKKTLMLISIFNTDVDLKGSDVLRLKVAAKKIKRAINESKGIFENKLI